MVSLTFYGKNIMNITRKNLVKTHELFEKEEDRWRIYPHVRKLYSNKDLNKRLLGLYILLVIWNQGYYRGMSFDYKSFKKNIKKLEKELKKLKNYKSKIAIISLIKEKPNEIKRLYKIYSHKFGVKKKIKKNKKRVIKIFNNYTGISKILHVMKPNLFCMWDTYIRNAFGVSTDGEAYLKFMRQMATILVDKKEEFLEAQQKIQEKFGWRIPIPKLLDEYFYADISLEEDKDKRKEIKKQIKDYFKREKIQRIYNSI